MGETWREEDANYPKASVLFAVVMLKIDEVGHFDLRIPDPIVLDKGITNHTDKVRIDVCLGSLHYLEARREG